MIKNNTFSCEENFLQQKKMRAVYRLQDVHSCVTLKGNMLWQTFTLHLYSFSFQLLYIVLFYLMYKTFLC